MIRACVAISVSSIIHRQKEIQAQTGKQFAQRVEMEYLLVEIWTCPCFLSWEGQGDSLVVPFPLLPVCLQYVHILTRQPTPPRPFSVTPFSGWSKAQREARWLQPDEMATASTAWPCKPGLKGLRRTPAAREEGQLGATSLFCFWLHCRIPAGRSGDGNEYTFWSCRVT